MLLNIHTNIFTNQQKEKNRFFEKLNLIDITFS